MSTRRDPTIRDQSNGSDLVRRVEDVLEAEVRPYLRIDGGDVKLVGVDADRVAQVRLLGSCSRCSSATMSLISGIEASVRARVPEIRFVEAVP